VWEEYSQAMSLDTYICGEYNHPMSKEHWWDLWDSWDSWDSSREWSERCVHWLLQVVADDWRNHQTSRDFFDKMRLRGFTHQQVRTTIASQNSYIARYWHNGNRVGFWEPRSQLFIAWKPNSSYSRSRIVSGFFVPNGVDYLSRQIDFREIRGPKQ
jgi:hypothetical protein